MVLIINKHFFFHPVSNFNLFSLHFQQSKATLTLALWLFAPALAMHPVAVHWRMHPVRIPGRYRRQPLLIRTEVDLCPPATRPEDRNTEKRVRTRVLVWHVAILNRLTVPFWTTHKHRTLKVNCKGQIRPVVRLKCRPIYYTRQTIQDIYTHSRWSTTTLASIQHLTTKAGKHFSTNFTFPNVHRRKKRRPSLRPAAIVPSSLPNNKCDCLVVVCWQAYSQDSRLCCNHRFNHIDRHHQHRCLPSDNNQHRW